MGLPSNFDNLTLAQIAVILAADTAQVVDGDLSSLQARFPRIPWTVLLAEQGSVLSGLLQVSDVGAVSNPALFDITTIAGAALDTGILDVSLYRAVLIYFAASVGTTQITVSLVDDAGGSITLLGPTAVLASGNLAVGLGVDAAGMVAGGALAGPLPRRIRVQATASGGTDRIRIEGRR